MSGITISSVYGRRMRELVSMPIGPYSHAIKATIQAGASLLFIAGQIALDQKGNIIGKGDIVKQYETILEQIKAIVEDAGGTVDNIVKLVHYVAVDVSSESYLKELYPKISEVRKKMFKKTFPASTMVGVSSLMHKDALIEVDAMAVIP
jgi:2-iminobutanoate/2-iminopropanoate deaminase